MKKGEGRRVMYVDVHCHLADLKKYYLNNIEEDIKNSNTIIISSSPGLEEFAHNEELSKKNNQIYLSFGIHPQAKQQRCAAVPPCEIEKLTKEKRISAIGECGFDLYNDEYKATEEWQDKIFKEHLEIAIKYDLPVILHVRRAMHKIFSYSNELKKCKAVIFHSWPGTLEEGQSLLKRGVNAYFSFGNTILHGHKQQVRSCALLPQDRILTETDAPYQPQKGDNFSSWKNLPKIIETIANLRKVNNKDLETQIETNFNSSLCLSAFV